VDNLDYKTVHPRFKVIYSINYVMINIKKNVGFGLNLLLSSYSLIHYITFPT